MFFIKCYCDLLPVLYILRVFSSLSGLAVGINTTSWYDMSGRHFSSRFSLICMRDWQGPYFQYWRGVMSTIDWCYKYCASTYALWLLAPAYLSKVNFASLKFAVLRCWHCAKINAVGFRGGTGRGAPLSLHCTNLPSRAAGPITIIGLLSSHTHAVSTAIFLVNVG